MWCCLCALAFKLFTIPGGGVDGARVEKIGIVVFRGRDDLVWSILEMIQQCYNRPDNLHGMKQIRPNLLSSSK